MLKMRLEKIPRSVAVGTFFGALMLATYGYDYARNPLKHEGGLRVNAATYAAPPIWSLRPDYSRSSIIRAVEKEFGVSLEDTLGDTFSFGVSFTQVHPPGKLGCELDGGMACLEPKHIVVARNFHEIGLHVVIPRPNPNRVRPPKARCDLGQRLCAAWVRCQPFEFGPGSSFTTPELEPARYGIIDPKSPFGIIIDETRNTPWVDRTLEPNIAPDERTAWCRKLFPKVDPANWREHLLTFAATEPTKSQ